jgi:transcriptional regulator with XRE-family HTH domain
MTTTTEKGETSMAAKLTFGEFFKEKRIALKKTLRQFCAEKKLDPGNISRLERGLMSPPQGSDKLEEYARYLQIKKGSDDWYQFFDLARIGAGRIPDELLRDEAVMASLPILFRTLRGQKISERKLEKLVELIKKA